MFASDDEDPSYRLRHWNISESPVKSYSLAKDSLKEISNTSDNNDYAPNLAETSSKSKRKQVVLVLDSENHAQNDEVMYTVHVHKLWWLCTGIGHIKEDAYNTSATPSASCYCDHGWWRWQRWHATKLWAKKSISFTLLRTMTSCYRQWVAMVI